MKILTVVGARPQFIKAAPVSRAFAAAGIHEILLHTGQHYDRNMSDVFFQELGLRAPDVHLGIGSGSHAEQTGAMLVGIEKALLQHRPDWLLIYGDTNSTLAGALAAAKLHIPVAHVEAGLRSFNTRMPEEINRIVADRLSALLFTPTQTACVNLRREGFDEKQIVLVGDVMYDSILEFREKAVSQSQILEKLKLTPHSYALATIHRAENTDSPSTLKTIFDGLALASRDTTIVVPLHPRTRKALAALSHEPTANLLFIEPLGFLDMQRLEMAARVIATDSGGVQKEAFWHRVPCVTLREETEWVELVEAGANRLCPPVDSAEISKALLTATFPANVAADLYGDGAAAKKIAKRLLSGNIPATSSK